MSKEIKEDALDGFLRGDIEASGTDNLVYLKRFKNPFKIRAITGAEDKAIKEQCYTLVGKGRFAKKQFDIDKYNNLLLAESIVSPNLNSATLQDEWGVKTPEALLNTMLLIGEIGILNLKVQDINGFDNLDETVDEAKN